MGKAAAKRVTTTVDSVEEKIEQVSSGFAVKQQFIGAALNLGWQLAVAFLLPVAAGAWLDDRFKTSPSYTLTGVFLAFAGSIIVIKRTVKEVNSEMPKVKKRSKNV